MITGLVSIILPTYSRHTDGYLQRALESALAQTYPNFELIIVDDGSVDGTAKLARQYSRRDHRIRYLRIEENTGIPAYTTALAFLQTKGDYISMLFDDCIYYPHYLETLVSKLNGAPELGMAYGRVLVHVPGKESYEFGTKYNQVMTRAGGNCVPNVCVMIRREVIERVGWADPHILLKRRNDWDLWIRIADYYPIGFIPELIAEEFGSMLSDSLSNLNFVYLPLSRKYVQQDRNSMLNPRNIENYDPFRSDFADLNDHELQALRMLELEHYVLTSDISKLITLKIMNNDLGFMKIRAKNVTKKEVDDRLQRLLYWCREYFQWRNNDMMSKINFLENEISELHRLIWLKDEHIYRQANHIYEQQLAIKQKDAHIYQQQLLIEQK
ncbi:glycosyltransferase [Paenibacillus sp. LMG 31460]|uniref:Glycosyltransferase n=1 Tax=Paenibacillus germinis TaxID=2654979 RepID=A0ABX1ZC65_9BACL|nr:glycosyltransferase family A protein [Paenibacillus germinis]NOU90930.1 glycosyltransferase [Paenibacillus germinis]